MTSLWRHSRKKNNVKHMTCVHILPQVILRVWADAEAFPMSVVQTRADLKKFGLLLSEYLRVKCRKMENVGMRRRNYKIF